MTRVTAFLAAVLSVSSLIAQAEDTRPYREGPVTEISFIKIKPGKFDEYMAYLAGPYRVVMEGNRKSGNITGFAIYSARAGNPHEADMYLTVTYANMAALDGAEDREAPLIDKVFGSRQKSMQKFAARESMREILGSELIRELILK